MRPVRIPSSSARPPRASGARKSTVASTTSAENIGSCSEDASYSAATSSPKWFSGNRGFARACAVERELAVLRVDAHGVPVGELALEQAQRQWVLDHALQRAFQRPRAVGRVPAGVRDDLLRVLRQLELDTAIREPRAQPCELELHDLSELLTGERLELDDLVDPVEELRPEELAHLLLRAQVRGHDQHGVAEVDGASVPVGQAAVVEDLQQDVEDLRVRLLDLVEEDHGIRTPPHCLRQL